MVLAADVVYDRHITEHFFKTLQKILQTPKVVCWPANMRLKYPFSSHFTLLQVVFLAIERRQSDPRDSDQVFASNFAYFKHKLDDLSLSVTVKQESIDFAQFFQYSRVPELTLWRVESADQISPDFK